MNNEIIIKMTVDGREADASIKLTSENMQDLYKQFRYGQAEVNGFATTLSRSMTNASFIIDGFRSSFGVLQQMFGKPVQMFVDVEKARTSFETLLGSADAAEKRMEDLKKFATTTPFELPQVVSASRQLEVLTKGALSTGAGLKMVGDVASGAGVGIEEVSMWIGRLYDGIQSGRPVGEAMMRLQELGIMSGETRNKLEDLTKAGELNASSWSLIQEEFSRYTGLMDKQSATVGGQMSNLSDSIGQVQASMGAIIGTMIKPYVTGFSDIITVVNGVSPALLGLAGTGGALWMAYKAITALGITILPVSEAIGVFRVQSKLAAMETAGLTGQLQAARTGFATLMGPTGWVITGITALVGIWGMYENAQNDAATATSEDVKQLLRQKAEYEALTRVVKNTTLSEEERNKALKTLLEKYPEYLKNKQLDLKNEEATNKALSAGNVLLKEKIRIKGMENQLQKVADEMGELEVKKANTEEKLRKASVVTEDDYDANGKKKESIFTPIDEGIKAGIVSDIDSINVKLKEKEEQMDLLLGKMYPKTTVPKEKGGTWDADKAILEAQIAELKAAKGATKSEDDKGREEIKKKIDELEKRLEKYKDTNKRTDVFHHAAPKDTEFERQKLSDEINVRESTGEQAKKAQLTKWYNEKYVIAKGDKELEDRLYKYYSEKWDAEDAEEKRGLVREGQKFDEEMLGITSESQSELLQLKIEGMEKELAYREKNGKETLDLEREILIEQARLDKADAKEDKAGAKEDKAVKRAESGAVSEIGISKATRAGDKYGADVLEENKKYQDEVEKIDDNADLTDSAKKLLKEEKERAHLQKLNEIKREYYDAWLGELAGLSTKEIDAAGKVLDNIGSAVSAVHGMMEAKGKKEADSYRTTENSKLDTAKKAELSKARTEQQKTAIEEKYAKKKDAIDVEANKKGQERAKTAFAAQKALSIGQAIISTYQGATAAFSNILLYPPPFNVILSGAIIAAGLANVAVIASQEMPKFARGGWVRGPGSGISDSIPAMLSNGEFVVNARSAAMNSEMLRQMNDGTSTSLSDRALRLRSATGVMDGDGVDVSGLHSRMDRLNESILNMHKALAEGGIHAKVTSGTAADITRKGLAGMRRSRL